MHYNEELVLIGRTRLLFIVVEVSVRIRSYLQDVQVWDSLCFFRIFYILYNEEKGSKRDRMLLVGIQPSLESSLLLQGLSFFLVLNKVRNCERSELAYFTVLIMKGCVKYEKN